MNAKNPQNALTNVTKQLHQELETYKRKSNDISPKITRYYKHENFCHFLPPECQNGQNQPTLTRRNLLSPLLLYVPQYRTFNYTSLSYLSIQSQYQSLLHNRLTHTFISIYIPVKSISSTKIGQIHDLASFNSDNLLLVDSPM